jgi:hypothetical protein
MNILPLAELDGLIAEQERDSRSFSVHSTSHDAWPSGPDAPRGRLLAHDERHGTLSMAKRYGCKCAKCRAASAKYQRDYNRRKGLKRRIVCVCCGSTDVRYEVTL